MNHEVTLKEIMYAKKGFIKACQKAYGETHGIPNFSWYTYPSHTSMVMYTSEYDDYQAHVKASKHIYNEIVNDPQYNDIWRCKAMINRIKKVLTKN